MSAFKDKASRSNEVTGMKTLSCFRDSLHVLVVTFEGSMFTAADAGTFN
jgi:hypothetical protein